jgi:hypothetical protein
VKLRQLEIYMGRTVVEELRNIGEHVEFDSYE